MYEDKEELTKACEEGTSYAKRRCKRQCRLRCGPHTAVFLDHKSENYWEP